MIDQELVNSIVHQLRANDLRAIVILAREDVADYAFVHRGEVTGNDSPNISVEEVSEKEQKMIQLRVQQMQSHLNERR